MESTTGAVPRGKTGGGGSTLPLVFSPDSHSAQVLLKGTRLPRLCPGRAEPGESWPLWAHQGGGAGRSGTHSAEPTNQQREGRGRAARREEAPSGKEVALVMGAQAGTAQDGKSTGSEPPMGGTRWLIVQKAPGMLSGPGCHLLPALLPRGSCSRRGEGPTRLRVGLLL